MYIHRLQEWRGGTTPPRRSLDCIHLRLLFDAPQISAESCSSAAAGSRAATRTQEHTHPHPNSRSSRRAGARATKADEMEEEKNGEWILCLVVAEEDECLLLGRVADVRIVQQVLNPEQDLRRVIPAICPRNHEASPRQTCFTVIEGFQSLLSSRILRQTVPEGKMFGWKKFGGKRPESALVSRGQPLAREREGRRKEKEQSALRTTRNQSRYRQTEPYTWVA